MKKIFTSSIFLNFANFAKFATGYFARVAAVLLLLVTMSVGEVWGKAYTVYFCPGECGKSWDSPYIFWVRGWGEQGNDPMEDTGETYNGHKVFTKIIYDHDNSGKFDQVKFHASENDWEGQIYGISSWGNPGIDGKLYNGTSWVSFSFDVPETTYAVTVSAGAGGSITTPAGGTYDDISAQAYSIAATASSGYFFKNWTKVSGTTATFANANAASTTVTVSGSENVEVRANFVQVGAPTNEYYLNDELAGSKYGAAGTVLNWVDADHVSVDVELNTLKDYGLQFYIKSSNSYKKGKNKITRANNSTDLEAANSSASKITVDQAGTYTFTYTISTGILSVTYPGVVTHTVTINNGDHGTVSPNGAQTVGSAGMDLTVTPAAGYSHTGWETTGGASMAGNHLTATADGTVTATYASSASCTPTRYELWSSHPSPGVKIGDFVEESAGTYKINFFLDNDNRHNLFVKGIGDDCEVRYASGSNLDNVGASVILTQNLTGTFAFYTATGGKNYKFTLLTTSDMRLLAGDGDVWVETVSAAIENDNRTSDVVGLKFVNLSTTASEGYTYEFYELNTANTNDVKGAALATGVAVTNTEYEISSGRVFAVGTYYFAVKVINPRTTSAWSQVLTLTVTDPVGETYYVYLGETYNLPSGTWTITSSDQARYYDNLTKTTEQYTSECSITSGNQFHGTTLGKYTISNGVNNATVYVYRYYAKYPWGACSDEPAADYNRAWKWQALNVVDATPMSVVGLYSSAVGNHANIGWDYHYDWNGIYRSDGESNPNVHPGVMNESNGIWTDGATDAKNYGAAAYLDMDDPGDLDCERKDYVKLTYESEVPASGTTAPTVGGTFTQEKYSTTEWLTLTYAAKPAAGGLVTHDASGDKVASGTKVTFTATEKTGYTFEGWYSDVDCTNPITGSGVSGNRYQLTVTADVTVYAKFERPTQEYYVIGDGWAGSWDLANAIKMTYVSGTTYTLERAAASGNHLFKIVDSKSDWGTAGTNNWGPDNVTTKVGCEKDGSNNNFKFNVESAKKVTITWDAAGGKSVTVSHLDTLTYGAAGGGTATCEQVTSGGSLNHGTSVTLVATPNSGYVFAGWYGNPGCTGDKVSSEASYTFSLTSNRTVYAKFVQPVFFVNSDNWEHVYVFAWDGDHNTAAWPGTAMTSTGITATVDGDSYDVYSYVVSTGKVIFNNGQGSSSATKRQTADLTPHPGKYFMATDQCYMDGATRKPAKTWFDDIAAVEAAHVGICYDWYLIGSDFGDSFSRSCLDYPFINAYRGIDGMYYREVTKSNGDTKYAQVHNVTTRYGLSANAALSSDANNPTQLSTNNSTSPSYNFNGTYWMCIDTRAGGAPKFWYEAPKTFHTVTVTETTNPEYGEFTLTTTPTGVPASMATTQYADGEQYLLSITVPNALVTPSITVDAASQSLTKEDDTHYTYTGTMGASDVAIEISYAVEYDFTFKLMIGAVEKYTGQLGQSVTFHTSDPVNFPCNPVDYSYWISTDDGANWDQVIGATYVISDLGTVLFKAEGMCSSTIYKEKVCTLTVENPVLERIDVTPATIYPNTDPITITPTISGFEGSPTGLFVCYEYTSTPDGATTSFAANGTRGACTTTVDKVGDYTVSAQLKYGVNCGDAVDIGAPQTADFTVLDNYVILTVPPTAPVGNVDMTATSNLVAATYTFYVKLPGEVSFIQFATGTSANANYNCSMVGSYTFKVEATKDAITKEDTKDCEVSAAEVFLRYNFLDGDNNRSLNNVPMTYISETGLYYYYQTTATDRDYPGHPGHSGYYSPISSYDGSVNQKGLICSSSSETETTKGWQTIYNDEDLPNSKNPVIFMYDPSRDRLYITKPEAAYRVKSEGTNGTFYSNVIKKAGDKISFYAQAGATLTWQSSTTGLEPWSDDEDLTSATALPSGGNRIYVATPATLSPTSLTLTEYKDAIYVYNSYFGGSGMMTDFRANSSHTFYDHYYVEWMEEGKKVGATVGNDINHNISHALPQYTLPKGANVRYEYKAETNRFTRTMIAGSTDPSREFAKVYSTENGNIFLTSDAVRTGNGIVRTDPLTLTDGSDWVYTADVQVKIATIGSVVEAKIMAGYNGQSFWILAKDGTENAADAKIEIVGTGTTVGTYPFRLIFDYKTNRLTAAWNPTGSVDNDIDMNANLLIIRKADAVNGAGISMVNVGDHTVRVIKRIIFSLEMDRDDLYNIDGSWKNGNASQLYQLCLPYAVKMGDMYGLSDYGSKWGFQKYQGSTRARIGWTDGREDWWGQMMYAASTKLSANTGYVLYSNFNRSDFTDIRLYDKDHNYTGTIARKTFYMPSAENPSGWTIEKNSAYADTQIAALTCNVAGREAYDSNWRCIGVPGFYAAYPGLKAGQSIKLDWFYKWEGSHDAFTPCDADDTPMRPTLNYMIQYAGWIDWKEAAAGNDTPSSEHYAPARSAANTGAAEGKLTLSLSDEFGMELDRTFVRLATNGEMAYQSGDLTKMDNTTIPQLYTLSEDIEYAGNLLPDTVSRVQIGLSTPVSGNYSLQLTRQTNETMRPYLYDAQYDVYVDISTPYEFYQEWGTDNSRFSLIFGYQVPAVPTGVDGSLQGDDGGGGPQKFIQNGVLYIFNNGKLYNANGSAL